MANKIYCMECNRFLTTEIEDILFMASELNIVYLRQENNTILFQDMDFKDFVALGKLAGVFVE